MQHNLRPHRCSSIVAPLHSSSHHAFGSQRQLWWCWQRRGWRAEAAGAAAVAVHVEQHSKSSPLPQLVDRRQRTKELRERLCDSWLAGARVCCSPLPPVTLPDVMRHQPSCCCYHHPTHHGLPAWHAIHPLAAIRHTRSTETLTTTATHLLEPPPAQGVSYICRAGICCTATEPTCFTNSGLPPTLST